MNGTRTIPLAELDARAVARFEAKYRIDESGCWIWTAARKDNGYGVFCLSHEGRSRQYHAHRVSYTLHVGPIPEGLHIDHLCRVTACVNPDHLEPVTNAENHRRQVAAVTHCPRGHAYTEVNTYRHGNARYCRECNRLKSQKARRLNVDGGSAAV